MKPKIFSPLLAAVMIIIAGMTAQAADNRILSFDGTSVKVIIEDNAAVLYAAAYEENGVLKSVEMFTFDTAGEYSVTLEEKADKAMLWDKNMKPYDMKAPSSEVIPTCEPTAIPTDVPSPPIEVSVSDEIALDYSTYPLYVGNASITDFSKWDGYGSYFTLTASVAANEYSDSDITWSMADESIAYLKSINQNTAEIRGRRTGVTTVTAALPNGEKASCVVTVIDNASRLTVEKLSFNTDTLNLSAGQTAQLKPIFYPKDIYNLGILNTSLSWQSSDTAVAVVDENGSVTAVGDGAAVITAVSADVGRTAQCAVTVKEGIIQNEIEAKTDIVNMTVGESVTLSEDGDDIVWKSDNSYIADVDENGVVTAYSNSNVQNVSEDGLTVTETAGTVKIYATAVNGGKTAEYEIRVADSDIADEYLTPSDGVFGKAEYTVTTKTTSLSIEETKEIDIDEVYQIEPTTDGDSKVLWINTNHNIATLDREGNVMGYNAGTINAYAVTDDSLTEEQLAAVRALQENRENADEDITAAISGAVYDVCAVTVKDSSPYLRNTHVVKEAVTYNSVNVLWNRAALNNIPDFAGYKVYINGEEIDTVTTLGYTFENLEAETGYTFSVSAVDTDGNEIISETVTAVTKAEPTAVLNVLDYGARGDGTTMDTYAIQKAINDCPENGMVYLPEGYVFYSGALFLKSDMTFKVDGVIIGSIDPKDYPRWVTKWEGWRKTEQTAEEWDNSATKYGLTEGLTENHMPHSSLINAGKYDEGVWGMTGPYNVENLVICGSGQINANGFALAFNEGPNYTYGSEPWTQYDYPVKDQSQRGRAITIHNGRNIYIKDITVAYSPSWTVHTINCGHITFDNMDVITQGNGNAGNGTALKSCGHIPNGDGIDPENCTNANIFNVDFSTGDDAVAMKSGRNREGNEYDKPNAYVRVTDCVSKWSLGGFGTGSENASGSHDILFQNITAENVRLYGIWIKTRAARGGVTENIQIRDLSVKSANTAIRCEHGYVDRTNGVNDINPADEYPVLRYVTVENMASEGTSNGIVGQGFDGSNINNITIKNCTFKQNVPSKLEYCTDFNITDVRNTTWSWRNSNNINVTLTWVNTDTALRLTDEIAVKAVDNENKTVTVYKNATGENLLDSITSAEGGKQTYILSGDNSAALTGDETLTVISPDGEHTAEYTVIIDEREMDVSTYIIAETFSQSTGEWGFTGDGAAEYDSENKALSVLSDRKNYTYVTKELGEEVSSNTAVNIRFDWQSHAAGGAGSYLALQDEDGTLIFLIWGHGQTKYGGMAVSTAGYEVADLDQLETLSDDVYRADLTLDFENNTISGTVKNLTDGTVLKTYENETLPNSPKNLAKMYAKDIYGAARMTLDNVYIKSEEALESVEAEVKKFNFGVSETENGCIGITADTEYNEETGYGFLGLTDGYALDSRLDGWTMTRGYDAVLENGARENANSADDTFVSCTYDADADMVSPIRFAVKSENNKYYKVKLHLVRAENSADASVSLFTEKRHAMFINESIPAEGMDYECSVYVHNNYSKSTGEYADAMLNIAVIGKNAAVSSLEIEPLSTPGKTMFVIGDSTVCDYSAEIPMFELNCYQGIGAMLGKYLGSDWAVVNEAEQGLSAKTSENHYNNCKNDIKPGDAVWFEFGHNDEKVTLDPSTNGYLEYLEKYYTDATERGAYFLVVSPFARCEATAKNKMIYNSVTGVWEEQASAQMYDADTDTWISSLKYYAETAETFVKDKIDTGAENIAFIDLNTASVDMLNDICKEINEKYSYAEKAPYFYYYCTETSQDTTHPNIAGADNALFRAIQYCKDVITSAETDEADIYTTKQAAVLKAVFENTRENSPYHVGEDIYSLGVPMENSAYPKPLQEIVYNEYPIKLTDITFTADNKPSSMTGIKQHSKLACEYARAVVEIYSSDGSIKGTYISDGDAFDMSISESQTMSFPDGEAVLDTENGDTMQAYFADYQTEEIMSNTFSESALTSGAVYEDAITNESTNYEGDIMTIADRAAIVWPAGGSSGTLVSKTYTLENPVTLDKNTTIAYKNAYSTATSTKKRYISFKNSDGIYS